MKITKSLKKQWMMEGFRLGIKDFNNNNQLNEAIPLLAVAGRVAVQVLRWLAVNVLPDLIREHGPKMVENIKKSKDKKGASKNAFKKMFYASLDKIPADKLANIAADKLAATGKKSINKELSKADGYIAPSNKEVINMAQQYKNDKETL